MPYIRLYARDLSIEQKSVIAQKLIEITLRTFRLSSDQRYQTSVQFITLPEADDDDDGARDAEFTLEVMGHDLTEEKKRAFAESAVAMLTKLMPVTPWRRITHLLGIKNDSPQHVALQFNELSAGVSDPFFVQHWAA